MKKAIEDVEEFHRVYGVPDLNYPQIPSKERILLRAEIIIEEVVRELLPAMGCEYRLDEDRGWDDVQIKRKFNHKRAMEGRSANNWDDAEPDLVEIADALADSIYVLLGTALEFGMGDIFPRIWNEVHRSNMSKLDNEGKPVMREDGKILKGPNFSPPDIENLLEYGMTQPQIDHARSLLDQGKLKITMKHLGDNKIKVNFFEKKDDEKTDKNDVGQKPV